MKKTVAVVASILAIAAVSILAWKLANAPSSGGGWLCCITDPASGGVICVQVKGIDSECEGGTIGWCDDVTTDPAGQATCHDT